MLKTLNENMRLKTSARNFLMEPIRLTFSIGQGCSYFYEISPPNLETQRQKSKPNRPA